MRHGMVWVGLGLMPDTADPGNVDAVNRLSSFTGAMAQSPPDAKEPLPGDLKTAELLGQRVAEATVRWTKGKA